MARAGWCRECAAWVRVTDDGACPNGHVPESIAHHVDTGDSPAARDRLADPFGLGAMPPGVERFNWGAFLVPALWGIGYRVWSLLALWAIALLVPVALTGVSALAAGSQSVSAGWLVFVTVASDAVVAYVRLWSGANANRLYWLREAQRLEVDPAARPRVGVERFLRRQRLWVVWGVIGAVLGLAISAPSAYELWKPYGLAWAVVAEPAAFLLAEVALGVWLSRRMRIENPDVAIPAEEVEE